MDAPQALAGQLLDFISFGTLALYAALGALAGGLAGLIAAWRLQRSGLLARRHRWHHLGLKLYFLALPAALGFICIQAALLYSVERQAYAQLEAHRPELKAYADAGLADFQHYLATADLQGVDLQTTSFKDLLRGLIQGYVRNHVPAPSDTSGSWLERAGQTVIERVQVDLISEVVARQLADKAVERTGLAKANVERISKAPLAQLFEVDFLLDLARRQIAAQLKGFYIAIGVMGLLVVAAVAGEILLSRRVGWHRRDTATPGHALPA